MDSTGTLCAIKNRLCSTEYYFIFYGIWKLCWDFGVEMPDKIRMRTDARRN